MCFVDFNRSAALPYFHWVKKRMYEGYLKDRCKTLMSAFGLAYSEDDRLSGSSALPTPTPPRALTNCVSAATIPSLK